MLDNQLSQLTTLQAQAQSRAPTQLNKAPYKPVLGWVSAEALKLVERHRQLLSQKELPDLCTGVFTRSMGLPCAHKLRELLIHEPRRDLLPSDFHPHWHLARGADRPPLILEPMQQINRGVLVRSRQAESSTRRDPSGFEIAAAAESAVARSTAAAAVAAVRATAPVEGAVARTLPTCTDCRTIGHRRGARICPMKGTQP